jgi:hypothetical protein
VLSILLKKQEVLLLKVPLMLHKVLPTLLKELLKLQQLIILNEEFIISDC